MKRFLAVILSFSALCACSRDFHDYSDATGNADQQEKMYAEHLSNNNIYGITQDKYGQIWIATFRGLNKFDGKTYTQYFCYDDNKGLFDSHITDVYKDSKDRLWVATVNGVCLYKENDSFERIGLNDPNRNISHILESSQGRIFMFSSSSLLAFDEDERVLKPVIGSAYSPVFANYLAGVDNTIWALTSQSITGYNASTLSRLGQYDCPEDIICSTITEDGTIWLGTNRGFLSFDTISRKFKEGSPVLNDRSEYNFSNVYFCAPISSKRIIFFTRDSKSYIYNIESDRLSKNDAPDLPFEIPVVNNVNCVFRDSMHNFWIGLEDNGYRIIKRHKDIFSSHRILQEALKGEQVCALTTNPERDLVIAATKHSGLVTYNTVTSAIHRYEDISTHMILCDSKSNLWVPSNNTGSAMRYKVSDGRLIPDAEYALGFCSSIKEDLKGNIWFGGLGEYVAKYDYKTDNISWIRVYDENTFTFIPALLPLNDTTIMISGFMRDPVLLNSDSGSRIYLHEAVKDLKSCIRRSVMIPTAFFKDKDGDIWMGTVANGLIKYSEEDKGVSSVPGPPCPDISSIEQDLAGNIWVSTMYGIGRLNKSNAETAKFFFDEKNSNNQYYDRSSCMLADGTIIFGGTQGITAIKAGAKADTVQVPFTFQDIRIFNKTLRPSADGTLKTTLSSKPQITLDHTQNSFSVSFAALDYTHTGSGHYYYKLDGYDKQWHDSGNKGEAYYTRVSPGNYSLRVRYEDDSHNIQSMEDSLPIKVKAAPWATTWAIAGYTLAIAAIAWMLLRMRRKIKRAKIERKRLEYEKEQEKHLNKMHMSFFANVAHEFRTPLTTILGPASILEGEESLDKDTKKLVGVIKRSADRMMSLVGQFLDLNKLDNDTIKLEVRNGNIIETIGKVVEVFEPNAKIKQIVLNTEGLDDDFVMLFDQDKVLKMLSNLLSNAIKYTETGGVIKVGFYTADNGQSAKIFVADNGIGIAPELREKVFERFYRVPGSNAWGTGIGLYYVKSLVQVHHGSISCESNEEFGKGTVFTITLPANPMAYSNGEIAEDISQSMQYPIENGVAGREDAEENEGVVESLVKVLVVDDDTDICNYLKMLLRSAGYAVKACFDADTALANTKEWEPDIIICDVQMPGKNGYEFCSTIRSDISLSHLPVILVTARTDVADQVMGLDSGASAYITKPFDPKYLFAVVKSELDKRHRVQRVLSQTADTEVFQEEESLSLQEKAFLAQLYKLMEDNLADYELDITDFANSLHISRTKLYYKVKGLTGESPAAFFKNYKLNKAAEMICAGQYNLSEISNMTGFASLSHFSTSFKKHFGMTPSEYAKNKK